MTCVASETFEATVQRVVRETMAMFDAYAARVKQGPIDCVTEIRLRRALVGEILNVAGVEGR